MDSLQVKSSLSELRVPTRNFDSTTDVGAFGGSIAIWVMMGLDNAGVGGKNMRNARNNLQLI